MLNSQSHQSYLKSPYLSSKHTTYFETYDELFSRYRGKEITFVEIGVMGGGSLFMWRDFFGEKARIIGVDLNPNAQKWTTHGFEIHTGSQSDEAFWQSFIAQVGPVDVVLDDGGHTYQQQIITTEMLLPHIRDGGMLVVEDTHTSYMSGYGPVRYTFIKYVKCLMDRINYRFGNFQYPEQEMRIWSIQMFESLVAFHINRNATQRKSEPVFNNGIDDQAVDFRHHPNQLLGVFDKNVQRFNYLKRIPGMRFLAGKLRSLLADRTDSASSLKKYFDAR